MFKVLPQSMFNFSGYLNIYIYTLPKRSLYWSVYIIEVVSNINYKTSIQLKVFSIILNRSLYLCKFNYMELPGTYKFVYPLQSHWTLRIRSLSLLHRKGNMWWYRMTFWGYTAFFKCRWMKWLFTAARLITLCVQGLSPTLLA